MLAKGDVRSFYAWVRAEQRPLRDRTIQQTVDACADADGIVAHGVVEDYGAAMSAARKVPLIAVRLAPAPAYGGVRVAAAHRAQPGAATEATKHQRGAGKSREAAVLAHVRAKRDEHRG